MSAFDPDFDDLPATLPIFPLTGVLLLPRARLPLNVFEKRYLNLVVDALGGDRMFGMVQPSEAESEARERNPAVYDTGCAGRIVRFEETDDGRFLIQLRGVARFHIVEELPTTRGYRRCRVDWEPFRIDLAPEADRKIDRKRLEAALRSYFASTDIEPNWDAIRDSDDAKLVTSVAMICPFAPPEKQAILVAKTLPERAEVLTTILEMTAAGGDGSDATRQ